MADHKKQRRIWYAVGGALAIAFLAFGASSFKSNLTPYVSFSEAMSGHKRVQVAGELVPGSTSYLESSKELSFEIADHEGDRMHVLYRGVKPGNFEDAKQIVAIGSFQNGAFHAEQLLVKCPSKYQGLEEKGGSAAS